MASSSNEPVDEDYLAGDPAVRREAFLKALSSKDWRTALAPHVISSQGSAVSRTVEPDMAAFIGAAELIATDTEKVHRSLELAGCRFSDALLYALARTMGSALVEPILSHLRTADGARRVLLERVLNHATPDWVLEVSAAQAIRRHLRLRDGDRADLLKALGGAGNLAEFIDEVRQNPPANLSEWSALGRSGLQDTGLVDLALASIPRSPIPLAYLLRIDPVPERVLPRVMACARTDWLADTLELAILDHLDSPTLIPLAELGVRLGGRGLAMSTAWVTSSKLSVDLMRLWLEKRAAGDGRALSETLWLGRRVHSADRALDRGRRGYAPDPLDAAALVRQLRGSRVRDMVREILNGRQRHMLEPVLRPMCAVYKEAAREVTNMCSATDPEVAALAREGRSWPDVIWPIDQPTQEIPPA